MRKTLLFLVFSLCFIPLSYSAEKVVTLANGEWAPFLSKKLVHQGFASHVVSRAFEISGIKVEYKWYDNFWKRAYKDAKEGKVNGSLVWSRKPEREIEMFYSDPVFSGKKDVFFYLKGSGFDWKNFKDLKGKILGGTIGYNYGKDFEEALKFDSFKVVRVKNDYLNFKALLLGRIDAFVAGEDVGYKILKDKFSDEDAKKITHHTKPVRVSTYHLILSRQILENRDFLNAFNAGLSAMKDSGEYQKMQDNYEKGYYSKEK